MTRDGLVKNYYALVIGTGRIGYTFEHLLGETRSHLGALRSVVPDKLIACCDTDIDKAKMAGKHFDIDYFGSVKEALTDKKYEVIVVATPTNTHANVINEICDNIRIPKIIVCEKPIAMNHETATFIINVCRSNNIKLIVNHNRRWHPAYKYVKEQLDKEIERNIRAVIAKCYGCPITVGVHAFDLMDWYSYGDDSICHYIDLETTKYKHFSVDIFTKNSLYLIYEVKGMVYVKIVKPDENDVLEVIDELSFDDNPMINLYKEINKIIASPLTSKDVQPSCGGKAGLRALELAMNHKEWEVRRKPRY